MKNKRILALLGVLSFVLIGCDDKPITPGSEIKHTVTFDKNYETENRFVYVEVIDGDPVAPLEVVREGYEVQWMIDGVSYDFTTPVVNNITLVASWEEILKPDTSKVESLDVSLNGLTDNATISVNDDVPLTIKILPTTANQGWNYTVSHPDVLSLNNEGVLHGIKAGNAALTITTKGMTASNTSLSKTINITVVAEIDVPSDRIIAYCEPSYSHVYAWIDGNTELNGGWPGELLDSHNENWKKKEYARTSLNIIFNEGGGGNQTDDLTISEAGNWYYYQNQWYTKDPIIFGTGGGGGGGDNPNFDPLSSGSHLDLPIWEDDVLPPYIQPRPADYWSSGVISPYQGSRTDIRDESIYFLMTTRFFDGDPSNNTQCWDGNWLNGVQVASDPGWRGDFKGLIQRLDYIKALGFTSIWITPVVQNASGTDYHGYHGLNFQKVDGRYLSSDTNFQDLITACHAKDMKIILDVVYNHTSNFGETNLLPMFRKNEPDWSINGMDPIGTQNGLLPTNYLSLDGGAQFRARNDASHNNNLDVNDIYHPEVSQDWEGFNTQVASLAGDCVDLNTENPIVAAYIIDCFGRFIKMGVDAFRIDTMKHISRLTFNKYYFPGILEYAHRLGNDNFFTFGEVASRDENVWNHDVEPVSVPFYTWKESKTYNWGDKDTNFSSTEKHFGDHRGSRPTTNNAWLNGLNYHTPDHSMWNGNGMIDFQMHHAFRDVGNAFRAGRDNSKYFNDATYNVMYVDSHDYGPNTMEGVRFNLGSAEWAKRMNLMWTFRGIPCIYYGSEIEFQRGKPIDQWDAPLSTTGRAYFGDHLSGSVTTTGFGTYSASSGNMQTTLNHTLAKHLQKLNQIRLAVPALRRGQMNLDNASGNETAFIRRYTSGGIDSLACVSVGGGASFRGLPNGRYIDLVSGNVINVTGGSLSTGNISDTNLRVYVYDPSNSFTTAIGGSTTYLS